VRWRLRCHRAFRIQQMLVVRPQTQFNQCPRIWRSLGLPSVVGLILLHRRLRGIVPHTGRFSVEVVFSYQGLLYLERALRINFLLPAMRSPANPFASPTLVDAFGRGLTGWGALGFRRVRDVACLGAKEDTRYHQYGAQHGDPSHAAIHLRSPTGKRLTQV
jgi:hypothetical protein